MESGSSSSFASNLSRGMHAAAQPLAILRARFYPEHIQGMKKSELLELALSSTTQIERVCTLFGYLQQLVTAESIAPRIAETNVASLLRDAIDGVELWFEDSGIRLVNDISNSTKPVLADRQRTLQALSAILMIAHTLSTKGDSVTLTSSETETGITIEVQNLNSNPGMLTAEANLGMAVAEAQIRSQDGEFCYSLQPLCISLSLPAAE